MARTPVDLVSGIGTDDLSLTSADDIVELCNIPFPFDFSLPEPSEGALPLNEHVAWREEAARRFPDLLELVRGSDTMYDLWSALTDRFFRAYDGEFTSELILRIYEYAVWCGFQPQGETGANDLTTCIANCFYQEIPTHPKALQDMPRWFDREELFEMREILSTRVGEKGFQRILMVFDKHES